jgi:hypothetical protein
MVWICGQGGIASRAMRVTRLVACQAMLVAGTRPVPAMLAAISLINLEIHHRQHHRRHHRRHCATAGVRVSRHDGPQGLLVVGDSSRLTPCRLSARKLDNLGYG